MHAKAKPKSGLNAVGFREILFLKIRSLLTALILLNFMHKQAP